MESAVVIAPRVRIVQVFQMEEEWLINVVSAMEVTTLVEIV